MISWYNRRHNTIVILFFNHYLLYDYIHHVIKEKCPNLMFFHFESIDQAGHIHTWGSQEYYDAAKVYISHVQYIPRLL